MNYDLRIELDMQKIAIAMANKDFSITDLAKAIGKSRYQVHNWLNARTLNPKQAGELAKALEVDVKDLI